MRETLTERLHLLGQTDAERACSATQSSDSGGNPESSLPRDPRCPGRALQLSHQCLLKCVTISVMPPARWWTTPRPRPWPAWPTLSPLRRQFMVEKYIMPEGAQTKPVLIRCLEKSEKFKLLTFALAHTCRIQVDNCHQSTPLLISTPITKQQSRRSADSSVLMASCSFLPRTASR